MEMRRLAPRVRLLWRVRALVWAVGLTVGAWMGELHLLPRYLPDGWPRGWITAGVGVLGLAWTLTIPAIRYRRWRYALRSRDLWIHYGILWRTVSVIPYIRLQFVDTEQGPVARILGLATLVVHTAAPGTAGRIPGLDAGEAEDLRERLAHLEEVRSDEPT